MQAHKSIKHNKSFLPWLKEPLHILTSNVLTAFASSVNKQLSDTYPYVLIKTNLFKLVSLYRPRLLLCSEEALEWQSHQVAEDIILTNKLLIRVKCILLISSINSTCNNKRKHIMQVKFLILTRLNSLLSNRLNQFKPFSIFDKPGKR